MPGITEIGSSASGGAKCANKPMRLHNTLVLEPALSNSDKKRSLDITKVNVTAVG